MSKKECPSCAVEIDTGETVCPICRYEFPAGRRSYVKITALILLIILIYPIMKFLYKLLIN
ncbi:hypothetical protein ACFL4T_13505 [candidate division KSB1 bacterium]